jgi:hypothetical protein
LWDEIAELCICVYHSSQLAEIHPKFVRGSLNTVLETMMTIAEAEQLEESTRKLACEFVVTLCEAREQAPGMMRKIPQLNHRLFMCLMNYLLDVEVRNILSPFFLPFPLANAVNMSETRVVC